MKERKTKTSDSAVDGYMIWMMMIMIMMMISSGQEKVRERESEDMGEGM